MIRVCVCVVGKFQALTFHIQFKYSCRVEQFCPLSHCHKAKQLMRDS